MAMLIAECALGDWLKEAKKIQPSNSLALKPDQNIFSSLQFIDDETEHRKHKAYSLSVASNCLAWLSIYYLSKNVLRFRGLIVDEDHRGKGYMSHLVKSVANIYKDKAEKIVSFSLPESINFHLKNGFVIENKFIAKPIEYYDPKLGKYSCNTKELITLMSYSLNDID